MPRLLTRPFRRVGIVNRGEPAVRFLRAARAWSKRRREPLEVVALYTAPDHHAIFVREADDAVALGEALVPGPDGRLRSAYLDIARVVQLLREARCDAVWPGWGFVSERPEFADACADAGLVFIGPSGDSMRLLGDKIAGKRLAEESGVPVSDWSRGPVHSTEEAVRHARRIGFPVLLKAAAGGGGRGIRVVQKEDDLAAAFASAGNEAQAAFGDPTLLVEAFAPEARHVEVQILADSLGHVHAVGTRDCSMQRRHQKVLEEAPAPNLGGLDEQLRTAAVAVARACGYVNAGTAEFLVEPDLSRFFFLEMNTRLQVEHPVTECVTGIDLVGLQIEIARGEALPERLPEVRGHAIEARLCAEDPDEGFRPSAGRLMRFDLPSGPGIRIDSGFAAGDVVPSEFDSMLAKVIATGATREEAIARLGEALSRCTVAIEGGASNRSLLLELVGREEFDRGQVTTRWLDRYLADRPIPIERLHHDAALAAAAIGEHLRARHAEVAELMSHAHRGLPTSVPRPEPRVLRFSTGGRSVAIEVLTIGPDRYRVSSDGRSLDVEYRTTGLNTAVLVMNRQRLAVTEVVTPMALHVDVDGVAHSVVRSAGGRIVAPVPAAVTHVAVKEGETVREGDRLLTLEVMKMEVPVHAPGHGRVERLFVDASSRVTAGQLLATIEVAPAHSDGREEAYVPFAESGAPPDPVRYASETLLGAILGYDFPVQVVEEALNLLRAGRLAIDRKLLASLVDAYVQTELLFDRRPGPDGVAPVDSLARHLRQLRARSQAVPDEFSERLAAALSWYGVTDLASTGAQECALLRIVQAHQALELRERVLRRALSAVIASDHSDASDEERQQLRDRLEGFAALVIHRNRILAEAAYTALYLLCDRPRQIAEAGELARSSREAFQQLAVAEPDALEADQARAVLDEMPHGALLSLIPEVEKGPGNGGERLLDLLVQRLYPEAERTAALHQPGVAAMYWTRGGRILALLGRAPSMIDQASQALTSLVGGDERSPVDIDAFIADPAEFELQQLEDSGASLLAAALPGMVRRFSANWGSVELGRLSRTFERGSSGSFDELRTWRDLHPARIEASEVARLTDFHLERLPAPGEVFLALARARQDASDERLICIAEVERIDPVRDPSTGRLLRIPSFERVFLTALHAMREAQSRRAHDRKLFWNRFVVFVRPMLNVPREEIEVMARRLTTPTLGLALEKVVVRSRLPSPASPAGKPIAIEWTNPTGHGATITFAEPSTKPVRVLSADERRIVEARRKGLFYPYELIGQIASPQGHGPLPRGSFEELDLDEVGNQLVPVSRPNGQNVAHVVVGIVTNYWHPFEDGLRRVLLAGDPTRGMGSLAEPECRRVIAALDLAERESLAVEWVTVSSGAKIAMDSGTENLDWTARVLARIVRFTQAGGTINIIVDGVNVGAQSYWNAEATMLMHCKGALIMTPQGSMLLTGKKALEFAGSVSAEDNNGIGGFERIMGPNGEAQYFAPDVVSAYALLFRHLALTQIPPGEEGLRRLKSGDSLTRDVTSDPYDGDAYSAVGEVFDETINPGRKKPFRIRSIMRAVLDADIEPLERWASWQGAESAVVWEAALGGDPVCCIGIESRPIPRRGEQPADGPDHWTSGTLFPLSSKKVARAINAASGTRPVVVLANLSGFDGSPDSLRNLQLEYGAEIGRAVVNFQGPIVFCVVSRYHGGAYVVFSQALNPDLEALALSGSFASVIGGGPAAAVVFSGTVRKRAESDPVVIAARQALKNASASMRSVAAADYERAYRDAQARVQAEVAREFDGVHTVERAKKVGSLSAVIPPQALRPELIARIRAGKESVRASRVHRIAG